MPDRIFFVIAGLAASAMILLALLPGFNQLPTGPVSGGNTDYSRVEISGDQLNRMVAGGESTIELRDVEGAKALYIDMGVEQVDDVPLHNPHFILATDLETMFAGRTLRVTLNVRAADRYGAENMQAVYALGNAEASGWKEFPLTKQFRDVTFTYDVPPRNVGSEPGYDYLAIRPVVPEKQRAILVRSIVFEPISSPRGIEQ